MTADDARRLEALWSGDFGDAYVDRNRAAGDVRQTFWSTLLADLRPRAVLEVGCNVGANLRWIAGTAGVRRAIGLDINRKALVELSDRVPSAWPVLGAARSLPFRDRSIDLVFTMGVLIHQPDDSLHDVMAETVRCARRFVFCGEYHAAGNEEVPYRGERGALFKRDYGRLYAERFPSLRLQRSGFLGRDSGWDDVTYWLFERV